MKHSHKNPKTPFQISHYTQKQLYNSMKAV